MMSPPSISMMNISRSWLHQSIWNGRILGLTKVDTSIKLDKWKVENFKLFENWESLKSIPLPPLVIRETYSSSTPLLSLVSRETYSTSTPPLSLVDRDTFSTSTHLLSLVDRAYSNSTRKYHRIRKQIETKSTIRKFETVTKKSLSVDDFQRSEECH